MVSLFTKKCGFFLLTYVNFFGLLKLKLKYVLDFFINDLFLFSSLIKKFVVLDLYYIKTFVLSSYFQLSEDMISSQPLIIL